MPISCIAFLLLDLIIFILSASKGKESSTKNKVSEINVDSEEVKFRSPMSIRRRTAADPFQKIQRALPAR
jgi:hypothetical protein